MRQSAKEWLKFYTITPLFFISISVFFLLLWMMMTEDIAFLKTVNVMYAYFIALGLEITLPALAVVSGYGVSTIYHDLLESKMIYPMLARNSVERMSVLIVICVYCVPFLIVVMGSILFIGSTLLFGTSITKVVSISVFYETLSLTGHPILFMIVGVMVSALIITFYIGISFMVTMHIKYRSISIIGPWTIILVSQVVLSRILAVPFLNPFFVFSQTTSLLSYVRYQYGVEIGWQVVFGWMMVYWIVSILINYYLIRRRLYYLKGKSYVFN